MSELRSSGRGSASINAFLLTTASALVLGGVFCDIAIASDGSADRPTVWIELGGQLERRDGRDSQFLTIFQPALAEHDLLLPTDVQQAPRYSYGGEAKLTLEPRGSNWVFSAAVRYGRSNGSKHRYEEAKIPPIPTHNGIYHISLAISDLSEAQAKYSNSHAILDFMAGKDVGLGLFGGKSVVGLGVRIAQFSSNASLLAYALPHGTITFPPPFYLQHIHYNRYTADAASMRSFHGIGPSIIWTGSAPIVGHEDSARLAVDWGLNASVLFGRQRAHGYQRTHEKTVTFVPFPSKYTTQNIEHNFSRSRSVVVPNIGASAAASLEFPNAKVTLGYRADFFFGVMDGGIDTHKALDRNFYGPFATISIGIGG